MLFGEHFGKVVLTATPIDPQTVDAWEYYECWANEDHTFGIRNGGWGYFARKSCTMYTITSDRQIYYIFQWIPEEKRFAIYSDNDCGFVTGDEELLAQGTYTNVGEKATLTFTEDNIFDGRFTVLELYVVRS